MIFTNYHKVPVAEVEARVIARLAPNTPIIEQASHIYPDAQFGETLSQVHDLYLNVVRDLDALPSLEVQHEKVTRDFKYFWYRVKLVFPKTAEEEVMQALKDNDIEIIDEIS